jgi:hypothetical protein
MPLTWCDDEDWPAPRERCSCRACRGAREALVEPELLALARGEGRSLWGVTNLGMIRALLDHNERLFKELHDLTMLTPFPVNNSVRADSIVIQPNAFVIGSSYNVVAGDDGRAVAKKKAPPGGDGA